MNWAHHIELLTPELAIDERAANGSALIAGRVPVPESEALTDLVNAILSLGHVYQLDVINPNCYCDISFGRFDPEREKGAGHPPLVRSKTTTSHHAAYSRLLGKTSVAPQKVTTKEPPQPFVRHIFAPGKEHANPSSFGGGDGRFAFNRAIIQDLARSKHHAIFLHYGDGAGQPTSFAETVHPVIQDGKVAYILRLLVDQENVHATYASTLYTGALGVFLLTVIIFYVPTARYLRAAQQQRLADQKSKFLATHDPLTGVLNRRGFQIRAKTLFAESRLSGVELELFLFDLDDFKEVNDFHGHQTGDRLLCAFAEALMDAADDRGIIARLGGDEFVLLGASRGKGRCLKDSLLTRYRCIRATVPDTGSVIETGYSGGLVKLFGKDQNLETTLRQADLALYRAKKDPGASICLYEPDMARAFKERLTIRSAFKTALARGQVKPHYQPLVHMKTGRIFGFEALARWHHPDGTILTPGVFGEFLEDSEIGAKVGEVMFDAIIHDIKTWNENGIPCGKIAMNIATPDLSQRNFAKKVLSELQASRIPNSQFIFEITENCIITAEEKDVIQDIQTLREAGCGIALDDFGTGYSSVKRLKEMPLSIVKVDKSFVQTVLTDDADQAIIASLFQLGEKIGFDLVLEGIETKEQAKFLGIFGNATAQGYYYGRPMPAIEVARFIAGFRTGQPEGADAVEVA
ncbi:MAG: bifunctional diguanylate cyclase/phosphodiesterase [Pseudomonadota bacterium]